MKCFNHRENESIGICKSCSKAVCAVCAIDMGRGLSCSAECTHEIDEQNQIIDKSKQIYAIGSKPTLMPTGLLIHFFFGLVFTGFGLYQSMEFGEPQWFLLVMGVGFLVIGCIGWYKNRKLDLNC